MNKYHHNLATYFSAQPLYLDAKEKQPHTRKLAELPWQYEFNCDWVNLYNLLADLQFFQVYYFFDQYGLKYFWSTVEANTDYRKINAYIDVIDNPVDYFNILFILASFLLETGALIESKKIFEFSKNEALKDQQYQIAAIIDESLAEIERHTGRLDVALSLADSTFDFFSEKYPETSDFIGLNKQALIHSDMGNWEEALSLHEREQQKAEEAGNEELILSSLNNQATILHDMGRYEEALIIHEGIEEKCRISGIKEGIAHSLVGRANCLSNLGNQNKASELLLEAETVYLELGDISNRAGAILNQASINNDFGKRDLACKICRDAIRLFEEIGNIQGSSNAHLTLISILFGLNQYDEVKQICEKYEPICRDRGYQYYLSIFLNYHACCLVQMSDTESAIGLYSESIEICRANKFSQQLVISSKDLAALAVFTEQYQIAETAALECEKASIDLQLDEFLVKAKQVLAMVKISHDDFTAAKEILREHDAICLKNHFSDDLEFSMDLQKDIAGLQDRVGFSEDFRNIINQVFEGVGYENVEETLDGTVNHETAEAKGAVVILRNIIEHETSLSYSKLITNGNDAALNLDFSKAAKLYKKALKKKIQNRDLQYKLALALLSKEKMKDNDKMEIGNIVRSLLAEGEQAKCDQLRDLLKSRQDDMNYGK